MNSSEDVVRGMVKQNIWNKEKSSEKVGKKSRTMTGPWLLQKIKPYVMIAPAMTIFGVFSIFPVIYMIYISFFKWNMIADMKFVGLKNFVTMFTDKQFWTVLKNTGTFMIMMVPTSMILSILIALYLKRNTRINKLLQNAMFMPHIISLVSISFIWMWMMDADRGLFNYILGIFHIDPVNWLGSPKTAMLSLVIMNVWKSLGYYVLILVAALQGIPSYLYEAAALDRAKPTKVFFKITLPMLSPTIFFLVLTGIIGSFKTFESVQLMTGGGPANSTATLVYELYQQGFVYYKTGYSSAMGVVLMFIVGVMTLIYFTVLQKKVHYQ